MKQKKNKDKDILEPGQQFGKDPNRFKTEFLKLIEKKINKWEEAGGYAAKTNEALEKDSNHIY